MDQSGSLTVSASDGVLDNDTDPENNPLTAMKASDPTYGTLTLSSDGSFTYTPSAGFSGTDSFTYKANDGSLDSTVATVTLTVNPGAPPDTTAPTVSSVTPTQTTKVPLRATISATFSEEMKASILDSPATNFKLQKLTGKGKTATYVDVPGVSVASQPSTGPNNTPVTKATLNPNGVLAANTTYKVTVTNGAQDLAGNALTSEKV